MSLCFMRFVYNNDKRNSKGVRNYNASSNREKCQEAIEFYKLAFDAEEQIITFFKYQKWGKSNCQQNDN